MEAGPNIILIGFMGTGKTTVGKRLAEQLGMRFADMDDCIVRHAGKSIPAIFADDGEPAFRAMERQVVIELSARRGLVVATGGGVVLNPANIADLRGSGLMVCLTAAVDVLLARLQGDAGRPLLSDGDKAGKVRSLLAARAPLYASIPVQIETDALSVEAVAENVIREYGRLRAGTPPSSGTEYPLANGSRHPLV